MELEHRYKILTVSYDSGWLFIDDDIDDCQMDDPESFVSLIKMFQQEYGGEVKNIGDIQYEITKLPVDLTFQWDSCFGNVIIVKNIGEIDKAVSFINRIIDID